MVKQNISHGKEHEEELFFSFVLFLTFVVPIQDPQPVITTRQRQSLRVRERGIEL